MRTRSRLFHCTIFLNSYKLPSASSESTGTNFPQWLLSYHLDFALLSFIHSEIVSLSSSLHLGAELKESIQTARSPNSFDTHLFWVSPCLFLLIPLVPNTRDINKKKRNERKINFNLHTYSSQWHVHTSFCLFTCFPFVQLLSILVVQGREVKRILFAWKLVWWASWETLRRLNCLMPGPLWIVGMPFFSFSFCEQYFTQAKGEEQRGTSRVI